MIVKGQEGHVICQHSIKVHYNQKSGDPSGHLGAMHHGVWGIDASVKRSIYFCLKKTDNKISVSACDND